MSARPAPAEAPAPADDAGTWLSRHARTQIVRRTLPDGTTRICKIAVGADAAARLSHEAAVLRRLQGVPGVPRLDDAASTPEVIAMQDDRGVPLSHRLLDGPLTADVGVAFAQALAEIVAGVHRRGVVHHDINPSNILVAADGRPVLIDYDIATTLLDDRAAVPHERGIVGTFAYIAPEQTARGRGADARSDLYSLGATLYEMLTGRPPFDGADPAGLVHDHRATAPVPPVARVPGLPPMLSDLVMRLLEKDADRRYQSAEGLLHDLGRLARGEDGPFALGQRDFPRRLAPSRLVGREDDVARLVQALDGPAAHIRCVFVTGEQGVGKTALMGALRAEVVDRRGWWIGGHFEPDAQDTSSSAVLQALRVLGTRLLAEPEHELAPLRERLLTVLGPNARLLAALLPVYATLLGVQPRPPGGDALTIEARIFESAIAILRQVASADRPVVLTVDDLQWASIGSVRFLETLLTADGLGGMLLVGACRDGELEAGHPMGALFARLAQFARPPVLLRLTNLGPAEVMALLQEMLRLPENDARQLSDVIAERTGGNPFDTLELVNALRQDGVLALDLATGWRWEPGAIRRYVGGGDVVDLLRARIDRLPPGTRHTLEAMACLAGEATLPMLAAATAQDLPALEAVLQPALEEGLLAMEADANTPADTLANTPADAAATTVRFWHHRVQRALQERLDDTARAALHLRLARALRDAEPFADVAAAQYLAAADALVDPDERYTAARLLHGAGNRALLTHYEMAERLLRRAALLLVDSPVPRARERLAAVRTSHLAALYCSGRHDAVVANYPALRDECDDPLLLGLATGYMLTALMSLGRSAELMAMGWRILERLGEQSVDDDLCLQAHDSWNTFRTWVDRLDVDTEIVRPKVSDRRVLGMAHVLARLCSAASHASAEDMGRIVFHAQRLWARHGPASDLLVPIAHSTIAAVGLHGDYRVGYVLGRIVPRIAQAFGEEAVLAITRNCHTTYGQHWFEPLEACVSSFRAARAALLPFGARLTASFNHTASLMVQFDCAATLGELDAEIEASAVVSKRARNAPAIGTATAFRQLLCVLRGQTGATGRFASPDFDELAFLRGTGSHAVPRAQYHINRALAAALFGDTRVLTIEASAAMTMVAHRANYRAVDAHLLQALSLARQLRDGVGAHAADLTAALDRCRDWIAARAEDSPGNFGHLLQWVDAERSWARGDTLTAARQFDAALQDIGRHRRPWQHALMTEHAALLHLEQGLESFGRSLMLRARDLYDAWGATEKVRALRRAHSFVPAPMRGMRYANDVDARPSTYRGTGLLLDEVDMLAILRSSQALSSETQLHRLRDRVGTLMAKLTGATEVTLVMRDGAAGPWLLVGTDASVDHRTVEQAADLGEVSLSAFRYVERTREALLVDDVCRDDRFARDGHATALERCSLLAVPIVRQGDLRGVLMLENRQRRAAFAADRLDAVTLIAGQLAVSLDNAARYDALERQVAAHAQALDAASRDVAARRRPVVRASRPRLRRAGGARAEPPPGG